MLRKCPQVVSANNGGGYGVGNTMGYYRLTARLGSPGRVTPSRLGFSFSPQHREYSDVVHNRSNRNYPGHPRAGFF
ncbi:MAG: hypothetical protein JSW47_15565 [Phycisphaerales bacterium]|nr:MAG: hypothetical protein JSW47_15565 [Phycisphaerales bacterium]